MASLEEMTLESYSKVLKETEGFEKEGIAEINKSKVAILLVLAAIYGRYFKKEDPNLQKLKKEKVIKNGKRMSVEKSMERDMKELFDIGKNKFNVKATGLTKAVFEKQFYRAGYIAEMFTRRKAPLLDESDYLGVFDNPPNGIILPKTLKNNTQREFFSILKEIKQGVQQGATLEDLSRRIEDRFEKTAIVNARRVVRTERHRYQNAGNNIMYKKSKAAGMKPEKILISTIDGREREQSRVMHKQKADEQGFFVYPNGVLSQYPGNTGIAKYDINDREVFLIVYDGLLPETERVFDEKTGKSYIASWKGYDEWQEEINKRLADRKPKPKPKKEKKEKKAKSLTGNESIRTINKRAIDLGVTENADFRGVESEVAARWVNVAADVVKKYPKLKMDFLGSTSGRAKLKREIDKKEIEKVLSKYFEKDSPQFKDLMRDELKKRRIKIGQNVVAQSTSISGIKGVSLNQRKAKSLKEFNEIKEKNQKSGFWSRGGADYDHVINHELGHELDRLLNIRQREDIISLWENEDIEEFSRYGATSIGEFVAEGWAEYNTSDNPRDLSIRVGEIIDNEYRKRFK